MPIPPDGYFMVRPRCIGSTDEEIEAIGRGDASVPKERIVSIEAALKNAAAMLHMTPARGSC